MCTSLQSIVNVYDKTLVQRDIHRLFTPKSYPLFELRQFYKHHLYQKNQHFNFFLDILEEWNRKVTQQLLPIQSDTLFHKNTFVFNSLRSSIMQQSASAQKVLNHLYGWFNTTRNRKVKPVQRKVKDQENDQDWVIRNTFKSNLPAEIDMYRRRECGRNINQKDSSKGIFNPIGEGQNTNKNIKVEGWIGHHNSKCLELKRTSVIENEVIRFQREAKELMQVQKKWKIKKSRELEGGIKNFYNGKFSIGKTNFPKMKNEKENVKVYSMRRLKTSVGVRQKKPLDNFRSSEGGQYTTISNSKRNSEQTVHFDQFDEVKVGQIAGLRLMSGPQETRLKKKKRAK